MILICSISLERNLARHLVFSRTKGPILQYLWICSFFKIASTFFSVGKISVLIVLQAMFTDNLQLSCSF